MRCGVAIYTTIVVPFFSQKSVLVSLFLVPNVVLFPSPGSFKKSKKAINLKFEKQKDGLSRGFFYLETETSVKNFFELM